jgi:hypothetical protein
MRVINRSLGCLGVAVGLALAGWAPPILGLLTGQPMPVPVASDPQAMAVWSGVAFARVCGAVLAGLGAVLFASSAPVVRPRNVTASLFASSLLATAVVVAQQVAIWTNAVGWTLAGLFGFFTVATAMQLIRVSRGEGVRAV